MAKPQKLSGQLSEIALIPLDYAERMDQVMKLAWSIFQAQFINERHTITTEAPFQHHFAQIIRQVGNLYCLQRDDLFHVDLEVQCQNIKGKNKYIDITCEFVDKYKCAIELKFKKNSQGAQDHGRIDMYVDIEALELVCKDKYDMGRFYTITDCTAYVNQSDRGVGTEYTTYHGNTATARDYYYDSKGRENVNIKLENAYRFEWEKYGKWYFLAIPVTRVV